MKNKILIIKNLKKCFHFDKGMTIALDGIDLSVYKDEFISIVGPSGCGKSTILSILARLEDKTSGNVNFKDNLSIGYMLQDDCLFDWKNILDNCLVGLEISNKKNNDSVEYVLRLLKTYGLYEFKDMYPSSLSGGMRQRVLRILYTHGIITYKWLITLINNGKEVYYVIR